jgi:hypothetical protein
MIRERYLYRPGHPMANENGMVPAHLADPVKTEPRVYVISDNMDALKHPATGRVIDSKAEFRRDTRAAGCVEVGTDPAAARPQPRHVPSEADIVVDIRRAIAECHR